LGVGAGVGLAAVLLAAWIAGRGRRWEPELLVLLLLALISFPWLLCLLRRRFDLFEPPIVLSGIWLFAYALPSVSILAGVDPLWNTWDRRAVGDTRLLLSSALVLSAGFLTAFLAGYFFFPARAEATPRPPRTELDPRRFRNWSMVTTGAALLLFAGFVQQIGGLEVLLANLHDRVRLFSGLNYLGLPILSLHSVVLLSYTRLLRAGRRPGLGFLAFFTFALGITTLQGSKTSLLAALLALVVARHYLKRPVRLATVVILAVAAPFAALSFDLFFREYLVHGNITTLGFDISLMTAARDAWNMFYANAFLQTQVLMLMVDGMPQILPFQLGLPYAAAFAMPIPRALFPDKPPVGTEIFSRAFFPELLDQGTSIPTSLVGEFYMNFGVAGVLLGGLLLGCGMRGLYAWRQRRRDEPMVAPLYGLVIGTLLPWVRGDSFGPTVSFLVVALPLVAIARLSSYRLPSVPSMTLPSSSRRRE
jgi:oligosaccharide repeat unit polymerase